MVALACVGVCAVGGVMGRDVYFWFPVMVSWFLKMTILKFSGLAAYRRLQPFFPRFSVGRFYTPQRVKHSQFCAQPVYALLRGGAYVISKERTRPSFVEKTPRRPRSERRLFWRGGEKIDASAVIRIGGGEALAVWRKRQRTYRRAFRRKGLNNLARLYIPNLYRLLFARGR